MNGNAQGTESLPQAAEVCAAATPGLLLYTPAQGHRICTTPYKHTETDTETDTENEKQTPYHIIMYSAL